MTNIIRLATLVGAVGALSACLGGGGGGGSSGNAGDVVTGSNALNIGTTSTTQSPNGLPFAEEGLIIEELEGETSANIRLTQLLGASPGQDRVFRVTMEDIELEVNDPNDDFDDVITLTINGNPVVFTLVDDPEFGQIFRGRRGGVTYFLEFESLRDYSAAISVFTFDTDDVSFESAAIVGFQTNPDALPSAGSVTYADFFNAYGSYQIEDSDPNFALLDVSVFIDVNFGTGAVGGEMLADVENFENGYSAGFDLEFTPTTLQGNGFQAAATTCTFPSTCTSNSAIGGAFFGPNGEELSGTTTIDVTGRFTPTAEDSMDPDLNARIFAVGGYTATPQEPGR